MKVFITGGTGYLGSALVERLVAAGHEVSALARSDDAAKRLDEAGAVPVRGSLGDTDVLREAAAGADAVIHAAVDYSPSQEASDTELAAVRALVAGGSGKPVVYTSTGIVYGFDPLDTSEDATLPEVSAQPVKAAAERIILDAETITGIVIRASLIFGRGDTKLITGLIHAARSNGVAAHIGDGTNTWYPVHIDDLTDLYLRAITQPAKGAFNAAGDVPFSFKELAELIGELTGTPVAAVPLAVAEQNNAQGARLMTTSSRLPTTKARTTYGWKPTAHSLLDEVRRQYQQ
ncbi:NAD-dependent epimerase/dehydratase family protein [Winogradskya humida]|uniref:3-beta hydroxysteroid dehydrogenase n=1 Tax=Winogradskya humida TaxID=113566 RepID=A0ABQ3ZZY0_9ACTN|nr:NAD-dependent epimerase/dehydratase family protein [Actinoplanes humidus]GIE23662.1 3-beta hydroxysteroid dehydrogenase [Actinoplanes humidus]